MEVEEEEGRKGEGEVGGGGCKWEEEEVGDVGGEARVCPPPFVGRPPMGPLGPTKIPPLGLQGCPPWPTRPSLGPAGQRPRPKIRRTDESPKKNEF